MKHLENARESNSPTVKTTRFELNQPQTQLLAPKGLSPAFDVFEAAPVGKPKAGVIVAQEIFGVNQHIRGVCEQFAKLGFLAWAPSLFDHVQKGVELGYDGSSLAEGRSFAGRIGLDLPVADIALCANLMRERELRAFVAGYCWGGSLAWLSATRLPEGVVAAASGYYGRFVPDHKHETPNAPVILHFGENDPMIPLEGVREFERARPETPVYVYPAGHGFNCDQREDYHAPSAQLALERTLALFERSLGSSLGGA